MVPVYFCDLLLIEKRHEKIKTRLIDERLVSVMGECVIVTL